MSCSIENQIYSNYFNPIESISPPHVLIDVSDTLSFTPALLWMVLGSPLPCSPSMSVQTSKRNKPEFIRWSLHCLSFSTINCPHRYTLCLSFVFLGPGTPLPWLYLMITGPSYEKCLWFECYIFSTYCHANSTCVFLGGQHLQPVSF